MRNLFFWHLWQVNEDVRLVLAEITRVQKALQVDYLPPSKLRSGQLILSMKVKGTTSCE